MEWNFEGLEMLKWNIPMGRAQRADEKMRMRPCLVIIFTPRIMIIKMSKIAPFFYFLLITGKNQSWFGQNN